MFDSDDDEFFFSNESAKPANKTPESADPLQEIVGKLSDDDDDFFFSNESATPESADPLEEIVGKLSDDDDDFFLSYDTPKPEGNAPDSADPFAEVAGETSIQFERMKIPFRPMTSLSNSTQESFTGTGSIDLSSAVSLPERKRKEYSRRSIMNRPRKQPYAGIEVTLSFPAPLRSS